MHAQDQDQAADVVAPGCEPAIRTDLHTLSELLVRGYRRFLRVPLPTYVLLLTALMLLRAGARRYTTVQPLLDCVSIFPKVGPHYACQTGVPFLLPYLLRIDSFAAWWQLHAALTALLLLGTGALLWWRLRSHESFRVALFWAALGAFPVSVLQFIGIYDVYTLAGGTLMALSTGAASAFSGGLLMGAAHPEQALVAACALLCAAHGMARIADVNVRSGALGVVLGALAVKLYALGVEAGHSRADLLGSRIARSLGNALQVGTSGVYAWYGMAWLVVVLMISTVPRDTAGRVWAALGLVLLPAFATLMTLDGSRVFVCTAWPAFAYSLAVCCESKSLKSIRGLHALTAASVCLAPLLPAYAAVASHLCAPNLRGVLQGAVR